MIKTMQPPFFGPGCTFSTSIGNLHHPFSQYVCVWMTRSNGLSWVCLSCSWC